MNCPACKKETRGHIYHCARCGVYIYDGCWRQHAATAHKKEK